jgi:VWFA-related protein
MMGSLLTLAGLGAPSVLAPAAQAGAQNTPASEVQSVPGVITAETNLVLVDVIATDKKGNYLKDLEKKEFHVFEDNAEQAISSFSRESDIQPNAPGRQRYMVLFFDDSTMSPALQIQARQAAGKFVEGTASPNRMMAVVDFTGTLNIGQNFTADGELLKKAISTVKYSAVHPNGGGVQVAAMGMPSLAQTESDFGATSVLLSIREVAKTLRAVPGRKTLILFSSGFPLTPDRESELTATIDALNKSNIAVYPVDVRGLATMNPDISNPGLPGAPRSELFTPESPFPHLPGLWAALAAPPLDPQHGGGGAPGGGGGGTGGSGGGTGGTGGGGSKGGSGGGTGTGGGTGGGTTGGSHGGTGSTGTTGTRGGGGGNTNTTNNLNSSSAACMNVNTMGGMQNPNCPNRQIIPQFPESVATNQQVLYALAKGTGGFEIFNTNDFLQGLSKISDEMNQYYSIGYLTPNQAHDSAYHKISVKVDRPGVSLRYRTGYYDVRTPDLLKGKPEGKALEERVASAQAGEIPVSLSAPYFYVEPGVARVNLALSIPASAIDFDKQKGDFHSDVNVLGIAYRPNGTVAARFSDTVKLDLQKKEIKDFAKGPFDYQNTFNIAPGTYTLKLVLSAGGQKFGKYEAPLVVEPFNGDTFALGGPALGERYAPVSQLTANMDAALLEERTPLVFKDMELVPSAGNRFAKTDNPVFYVEVYDPALKESTPPRAGILFSVIDRKTNKEVFSSNTILINDYAKPGNPFVPAGFKLPINQLAPGDYRMEIKGRDSMGNASTPRSADFSVE